MTAVELACGVVHLSESDYGSGHTGSAQRRPIDAERLIRNYVRLAPDLLQFRDAEDAHGLDCAGFNPPLEVAGGLVDDTPEIGNTLAHDLTLGVLDLGIIVELRAYPVRYRHRKLGLTFGLMP